MSIADELITRGWYQGDYEGPDGSVCLAGAVECALFGEVRSMTKSLSGAELERALHHMDIVKDVLRGKHSTAISEFNDTPGRTFDEVLRVAKEADALLDQ